MDTANRDPVIVDFAAARRHACREPRISLIEATQRIERSCRWLAENSLVILGFGGTSFSDPIVFVSAKPAVYSLFSGRYERLKQRRDGALRYETWEGRDRINNVNVRWEEVIACAS